MNTIANLQIRAYAQSVDKGFHDNAPASGPEKLANDSMKIALMHSELSEALEELRAGLPVNETYYSLGDKPGQRSKPEGVPAELADVVIRIMDFCGANDINLEAAIVEKLAYNATRSRMHGGKKF